MTAYAIKIINGLYKGTYYAGCNKSNAKTLLGAQLYATEKKTESVITTSVNFHFDKKDCKVVKVELSEISE